jgi:hypothetical protein
VLAIAVAGVGTSQAQSGFKVTGGGQTITNAQAEDGGKVRGPGDTFGFNAQDLDGDPMTDAAKGQFNTIQRETGPPSAAARASTSRARSPASSR